MYVVSLAARIPYWTLSNKVSKSIGAFVNVGSHNLHITAFSLLWYCMSLVSSGAHHEHSFPINSIPQAFPLPPQSSFPYQRNPHSPTIPSSPCVAYDVRPPINRSRFTGCPLRGISASATLTKGALVIEGGGGGLGQGGGNSWGMRARQNRIVNGWEKNWGRKQ